MNNIKEFFSNFIYRSGSSVILATIISRLFSFSASWIALKLIPNKEFGTVIFSYNIILFILPFSGLGLYQSFIRYAPFLKRKKEKLKLFNYVLKRGIQASLLLILGITIIALIWPYELNGIRYYIILLSFILIPEYILQLLKIQFRVLHQNKKFASLEILYNFILVILVFIFCTLYEEKGYIIALLLAPTIAILFYFRKFRLKKTSKPSIVDYQFFKYGFFSGLTSVVSQLLISIDVLLIGILLINPKYVTDYKYISIIPMSMLFMSNAFMATDFVTITERILELKYIKNYIKNYIFIFSAISSVLIFISYFYAENLLSIFDTDFVLYKSSFFILTIGVSSILILRGLFGNLLCSIGQITVNLYISIVAILLNCAGNYYLIPIYGIKGAAITSASIMWLTSILSAISFYYLYRQYLNKNKF